MRDQLRLKNRKGYYVELHGTVISVTDLNVSGKFYQGLFGLELNNE